MEGLTALRINGALPRGDVSGVALSPGTGLVAAAGGSSVVVLDGAGSGRVVGRLAGHTAPITDVKFAPDELSIFTCSQVR